MSAQFAAVGAAAALAFALAAAHPVLAQDECFRQPSRVDIGVVTEPLLLRAGTADYLVTEPCYTVSRRVFGTTLNFAILNRFPAGTTVTDAYVLIKSNRTLTTSPPVKVSLSRGDGWFLQERGAPGEAGRMNSEPFTGTIDSWNAAHASPGSPLDLAQRLKLSWHAFATRALAMPSTVPIDFWKVEDTFDRVHGVRTNYLIRFAVNTTAKISPIPFQVYIQREVRHVELTMFSNIDALSGTYKFQVR